MVSAVAKDEILLIVTADDFGMTPERDAGIIRAKKEGIITNTSLLVNGSTAREAVEEAKRCGLSIGLHLNLTEGPPTADAATVSSLLGTGPKWWPRRDDKADASAEELQFLGKEGIRQALKDGKISMIEAEIEVRAQLTVFREMTGSYPTYLDGHQHVHVLPGLAAVIARVAGELGVKCVRIPFEDSACFSHVGPVQRRQFYEQVACQASAARVIYAEEGLWFPSDFVGFGLMGSDISEARLQERLLKLASDGPAMALDGDQGRRLVVGEYMTHVGYASASGDDFAKSPHREQELAVLTDPALPAFLKQHAITTGDYEAMLQLLEARGNTAPPAAADIERRRAELLAEGAHSGRNAAQEHQPSLRAGGVEGRSSEEGGAREEGAGGRGRLVVVASLTKATGNCMTAQRMARIAHAAGWHILERDVAEIADAEAMARIVAEVQATAVMGVHLHRAGRLFIGLSVPYCLVLGGTDVNVFTNDENKCAVMQKALDGCRCVVSFNEGMLDRMRQSLAFAGPVFIIPQTAPVQVPSEEAVAAARRKLVAEGIGGADAQIFLLPCGIRPVKDPTFLLRAWKELHRTDAGKRMWLLIVGPVLDRECMLGLEQGLKHGGSSELAGGDVPRQASADGQRAPGEAIVGEGVAYLPPVEHLELLSLLHLATAVVNSSVAEGMCGSLLEAMALRVPVLARAVPGNLELVRHRSSGLLFATPAEAIQQANDIARQSDLRQFLTNTGLLYLNMHHSVEKERDVLVEALSHLERK